MVPSRLALGWAVAAAVGFATSIAAVLAAGKRPNVAFFALVAVLAAAVPPALARLGGSVARTRWPAWYAPGEWRPGADQRAAALESTLRRLDDDPGEVRRVVGPLLRDAVAHWTAARPRGDGDAAAATAAIDGLEAIRRPRLSDVARAVAAVEGLGGNERRR